MRQVLLAALICSSLTFPALARSGGHGGGAHGGGGRAGGPGHTAISRGFRGAGFNRRPAFGFRGFPRIYPFSSGFGYYGYYDSYGYSSDANGYPGYNSDYGYPAAQAPAVIVNQEFQTQPAPPPMVQEFTQSPPPPAPVAVQRKYDTPLYIIAFNDGMIRAVLAYWVDGAALHYVTMEHAQKQAALASVDRALSERLNGERNVTFQLPR